MKRLLILTFILSLCACNPCKRLAKVCPPVHDTTIIIRERIVEVTTPADTVILTQDVTVLDTVCVMQPVKYEDRYVKVTAEIKDNQLLLDVKKKAETLYVTVTDTVKIIKDVFVLKEKVKELTRWQAIKVKMGEYLIAILIALAIFALFALRK